MKMKPMVKRMRLGIGEPPIRMWVVMRSGKDAFHFTVSYWSDWSKAVRHAITGEWAGE